MKQPVLMPKATAVWLISNTTLTFEQIAKFCDLHLLEVQGIADGEVAVGIPEENPIINGQLTREEIVRCELSADAALNLIKVQMQAVIGKKGNHKYIPIAKRRDKPDAIAWVVKNYPEVTDAQIIRLLGTTKNTIASVRDKQHWNTQNIKPRDPVLLGLCSQIALNELLDELERNRARLKELMKEERAAENVTPFKVAKEEDKEEEISVATPEEEHKDS